MSEPSTTPLNERGIYWQEETNPEDRGVAVQEVFDAIEDEQGAYRQATVQHMRMYRNLNLMGYGSGNIASPSALRAPLSLNVIRNMVNAVHSKITKHRVKATYQTIGGNWEQRERARLLDTYGLGLELKEKLPEKTPRAFLDCGVVGMGVMKTFRDGKRVTFERVFSPNLVVDFAEGAFGTPAHYYEVKYIDQRRLMTLFPEKKEEISELKPVSPREDEFYVFQDSPSSTMVRVVEALYIDPDDPTNGFLSIVSNGKELSGSKWRDGDPYDVIRWGEGNIGWHGMGLAEELKGIQIEINRLLRKIQAAFGLLANPYILADRSSAVGRGQVSDVPGSFIFYNGKEPRVVAPQTVNPEVFAQLDRLYQRAYEIAGVSQLSAQAQKPVGFESGRALLVYEDIESDRFAHLHRQWDDLHVNCLAKGVKLSQRISGYTVPVFGNEEYEELNFKEDIGLDDNEWSIFPMPTALLGETPAAQVDMAERLIKAGLVTHPEEILEQMTSPDVRAYVARVTAPKRLAEKMVGRILQGKPYVSPEPHMNLALTLEVAQSMYLEAKLSDCPEPRLEKVRKFMERVVDLLNTATQGSMMPPTVGGGPPPGMPPGGPMPMPGAPAPMSPGAGPSEPQPQAA